MKRVALKELKPLYANLQRLHIGYYLESSDFKYFCLENDFDEQWDAAMEEILRREKVLVIGGPHYPRKQEEAFIFLLSLWHENTEDYSDFLLNTLLNFARWKDVKIDLNPIYENLKRLGLLDENLLKFAKEYKLIRDSKPAKVLKQIRKESIPFSKNQVFIVHGHDNGAKIEVARFIENLGLEAIILSEQVSGSSTIIEKLEKYTNVAYGIVLYTACDIGNIKGNESNLNNRARQNVVLEHGYLMGKIDRKNVTALVKGDIETPSDISGVIYTKMDSANGWKLTLAREMKARGLDVDMNRL